MTLEHPRNDVEMTQETPNVCIQQNICLAPETTPQVKTEAKQGYLKTEDGYCVSFVQKYGHSAYKGNADQWVKYINSDVPVVGAVVILKEGWWLGQDGKYHTGHLAKIIGIAGTKLWLVEQNYEGRWIISFRTIDVSYENILGYVLEP